MKKLLKKDYGGLYHVPDHFNIVVPRNPYALDYVPDQYKTQKMCDKAVRMDPDALEGVPNRFKTQEMCDVAVMEDRYALEFVPDYRKSEKMCDKVVWEHPSSLQYVPDLFVTQEQVKSWHDNDKFYDDNKIIEWYYKGHQKRKVQKAQIKKELMPITWHPSRWWDWCVPEDEKKETE